MYKTSLRAQRVANNVHRQLAKLFRHDITDTRLSNVQISFVDVSADLRNAKVFFCLSDKAVLNDDIISALSKAAHFLRKRIAASLVLRVTPKLQFEYDATIDRANRLDDLLLDAKIISADLSSSSAISYVVDAD